MILFLIYFTLIAIKTSHGMTLNGCVDECGIAPLPSNRFKRSTSEDSDNSSYYYDDYEGNYLYDENTRIVNGYESQHRPWLVMIHAGISLCGGTLINKKCVKYKAEIVTT